MNFGYKETIKKQEDLVSIKNKVISKSKMTFIKICLFVVFLVVVTTIFLGLGVVHGIIKSAPNIDSVSVLPSSYSSTVYDKKDKKIAKLITTGSNRIRVNLDDVPDYMQQAFIDTEDVRFYDHNGIDIYGIGRAAMIALTTQNASEGASTLTQQVLKNNVFTDWTKESSFLASMKRKIQEQYLAVQLEQKTNKKTILENYLNSINLGSNTLGVQAASQRYFNKSVNKLTLSEATVIAGITQNPTNYNPILHPKLNKKRRKKILRNMLKQKHITQAQYDEALKDDVYNRIQKVNTKITKKNTTNIYSYFVDEVVKQVMEDLQNQKGYTYTQAYNAVYSGGLKIYSTQDSKIQKICDEEMSNPSNYPYHVSYSFNWAWTIQNPDGTVDNFNENDIVTWHTKIKKEKDFNLIWSSKEGCKKCVDEYKRHLMKKYYKNGIKEKDGYTQYETLYYTPQPQASFTVMDQKTGYVKAIVGGRGKKTASLSLNRASDSTRQPGSCFKILSTYAPALDTMGYTLASKIVDSPFKYATGRPVKNWYSGYRGTVTVRKAIADSMNVCAVKTLTEITPQLGFDYVCNFGITTLVKGKDNRQPLALGGITRGVTNLEMTGAYATIANDGVYTRPAFYTKVVDSSGNTLLDNTKPITHTVLKSSTATLLTQAMTSVIKEGTGRACKLTNMPASGKTGTTSSSYDLWFSGYTPYLTASIWTGYDENKELSGDQAYHERLWAKIMDRIDELKKFKEKDFEISKDVKKYYGGGANGEYFAKGTEPDGAHASDEKESSSYDYDYDYDNNYNYNNNNRTTTRSSRQKATEKSTVAATKKQAETKAVAPTKQQQGQGQTQKTHWN